jgi:hypothetical protein
METFEHPKLCFNHYCNLCDYGTSKKSSFDNHKISQKHQKNIIDNNSDTKDALHKIFTCGKCNKKYLSRNGLWKHKKKCLEETPQITSVLILEIIKNNHEMKQLLFEQNNIINEFVKKFDNNKE